MVAEQLIVRQTRIRYGYNVTIQEQSLNKNYQSDSENFGLDFGLKVAIV